MKYAEYYDTKRKYRDGDVVMGAEDKPYVLWEGYWRNREEWIKWNAEEE